MVQLQHRFRPILEAFARHDWQETRDTTTPYQEGPRKHVEMFTLGIDLVADDAQEVNTQFTFVTVHCVDVKHGHALDDCEPIHRFTELGNHILPRFHDQASETTVDIHPLAQLGGVRQ